MGSRLACHTQLILHIKCTSHLGLNGHRLYRIRSLLPWRTLQTRVLSGSFIETTDYGLSVPGAGISLFVDYTGSRSNLDTVNSCLAATASVRHIASFADMNFARMKTSSCMFMCTLYDKAAKGFVLTWIFFMVIWSSAAVCSGDTSSGRTCDIMQRHYSMTSMYVKPS